MAGRRQRPGWTWTLLVAVLTLGAGAEHRAARAAGQATPELQPRLTELPAPQPPPQQPLSPQQPPSPPQPPSPQQPRPTFRARTDIVLVDIAALDRDGRPVGDIKPEEFQVMVDGTPRAITSVEYFSRVAPVTTANPGAAKAAPAAVPAPARPAFSTNSRVKDKAAGRTVLLIVDHAHITSAAGRREIEALSRYIDRLGPSDAVGLAVIPDGAGSVEFTTDREAVRAALTKVIGRQIPSFSACNVGLHEAYAFMALGGSEGAGAGNARMVWEEACERELVLHKSPGCDQNEMEAAARRLVQEAEMSTRASMSSLRALTSAVAGIPGPKTFVMLSQGLPVGPFLSSSPDFRGDARLLAEAASRSQVTIHILQMDRPVADASTYGAPPSASEDNDIMATGLEHVAGVTGGNRFLLSASPDKALDRVVLETSGYYLLGFESVERDRDGKLHKIGVKVTRPGVSVRARTDFAFDTGAPALVATPERALADVLRSPVGASALPVSVATYAMRDAADAAKVRLVITAEIDELVMAPARLSIGFVILDDKGKVVTNSFEQSELAPSAASGRYAYTGAAAVPPGSYTLRLGALDPAGRAGSVSHPFDARLTPGDEVVMSDVMLIDSAAGQGKVRAAVEPRASGSLTAYAEAYVADEAKLKQTSLALEIAEQADGPALVSVPVDAAAKPGQVGGGATIALGMIPPGEYVARAVASRSGTPVGRVSRAVHVAAANGSVRFAESAPYVAARGMVPALRRDDTWAPAAIAHFLDWSKQAPDAAAMPAATARAAELARGGTLDAALGELGAVSPDDEVGLWLRGAAELSRGEIEKAEASLQAALGASPEFLPALFHLGACRMAPGREADALSTWQDAMLVERASPLVARVLADALMRLGDVRHAYETLVEATALWPEDAELQRRFALASVMNARVDEAIELLEAYVPAHPSDHQAILLAMACLYETHRDDAAADRRDADRARAARLLDSYAKSGGPSQAIVSLWAKSVAGR